MKNSLLLLKLTFIQFLLFCSQSVTSQCSIDSMYVEITACEEDMFDVSIDFAYENTSDQFTVHGNGNNYGTFNYDDLPITLTSLDADCETPYEFVVIDFVDDDCSDFIEWGDVCCDEECELWDLVTETSECDGGNFALTFDFNYQGNTSSNFDWVVEGVLEGTASFGDLPLTITVPDAQNEILVLTVTEANSPNCTTETTFENPCANSTCEIGAINLDVLDCVEGEFGVVINFEHAGTSNQFKVSGNGMQYGTYSYDDLPITIDGLDGNCETEYEFVVTDVEFEDCSNFYELGTVCCGGDCVINSIDFGPNPECVEGFIITEWFIFAENTSEVGFDIFINDDFYTFVQYNGDGPYDFDIENPGTEIFTIKACDNDNPDCCYELELENPCYEGEECDLFDLVIETSECDGGVFNVTFDFEYTGTTNNFFDWEIPGVSSGFAEFADLPLTIEVENSSDEVLTLFINENDNPDCAIDGTFENPCYTPEECFIGELNVEVSECDGNFFFVVINFEYENTSDQFKVTGNGTNYGTFSYDDLPITIDGIESDCNIEYEFIVTDINNNDCASDVGIGEVCCEGDCIINSIDFEGALECVEGFIVAEWFIFGENTSEVGYDIFINDDFYTFVQYNGNGPYNFEIENPGTEIFTIKACDNDNPDCCYELELENPCYEEEECNIYDLVIETSECDGGVFQVTFDFEYTGTTNNFFDWEIPGYSSGFAEFADLPLSIIVQNTNESVYELIVSENDNPDCSAEGEFENPCYEEEECFIGELNVEVSECEDNMFFVVINFEYENTSDEFEVFGNGNNYGTFLYEDLPITIDGLEGNCDQEYEFIVKDSEDPSCASDVGIGVICCEDGECDLFDLVIETSECDGGVFTVTFDFEYTGTTNDLFNWEIPGVDGGTAAFADLPKTITIQNTNQQGFGLIINENDNEDCAIDGEIANPCFDPSDCFIGELNVEVSECEDNMFFVVINFEYENTSDEFEVFGNGNNYGTFLYEDLPITIDGLEGNCDLEYEFIVKDSEDPSCASDVGIGVICCEGGECDLFDLVIETSECDGGVFTVTFDFEYTGTTNDLFNWEIPGVDGGTAAFADLPKTITIQNTNEQGFVLIINENDNEDCAIDGEFANPCFDPSDCFIGELNVEVSECEDNMFFVVINFEYENASDAFEVFGNGNNYGTFLYEDLPITIDGLEGNCDLEYEFIIKDSEDPSCASDVGIGVICCEGEECDLFDLDFEISECDGGYFVVEVYFEYTGNTSESFDWEIPGIGSGNFPFASLPLSILIENTTESQFTFFANENDNPDCAIVGTFGNPCYDEEDCEIDDVTAEIIVCEDDLYDVEINFEYSNTSGSFTIHGNGVEYGTFEYGDLPVILTGLDADCDTEYEFIITDAENEDCSDFVVIGTICCEDFNQINGLASETIIDGEAFKVTFNIDDTTLKDCDIEVYIDGELTITLTNGESSFTIGPFECGQEEIFEIKLVNTCSGNEMIIDFDLSDIDCVTNVEVPLDSIDLKWNMAQKLLSVEGDVLLSVDIQVMNIHGALILSENNVSTGWNRDLSDVSGGIYIVRVVENQFPLRRGFIRKILVY